MENKLTEIKANNVQVREIEIITAEIKDLCRQAKTIALLYAVEIGRRLIEAKQALPHGKWGEWLKNEVEFSQSSANNFMKLFEEYGSTQISIFGATLNSQSIANLPYSKALQLLAIPKDERATFAEEVGAEDLTVKELKAAIEERDKAKQEAETARANKKELEDKLENAEKAVKESQAKADEASALRKKLDDMASELERAKSNASSLAEQLKKAESDPKIPKKTLDKIRSEATEAANKEAELKAAAKIEEAKKELQKAEKELTAAKLAEKEAKERLEEAKKKLKTASPEVTTFKTLFDTMQATAVKLNEIIIKIRETDVETADKLTAALKAFGSKL